MLPQRGGRQPSIISLTRDSAGVDPGAGDRYMPEPLVGRAMGGVEGDDRRQMGLFLIGQPLPATPLGPSRRNCHCRCVAGWPASVTV